MNNVFQHSLLLPHYSRFKPHLIPIRKIYWGLGLIICLSLATALTYAFLRSDVSGGFTIASYMIACLALVGALLAAGEWFGLATPDASAYQLDLETGDLATTGDVDRFIGVRLGRGPVEYH